MILVIGVGAMVLHGPGGRGPAPAAHRLTRRDASAGHRGDHAVVRAGAHPPAQRGAQPAGARDPQLHLEPLHVLPGVQGQRSRRCGRSRRCWPTWTRWPRPRRCCAAAASDAVREGLVPRRGVPGVAVPAATARARCFLQDADPCAVKPEKLAAVIRRVARALPDGRARDHLRARERRWRGARRSTSRCSSTPGLTRVHLGLESGADEVLMAIDKGCTSGDLIAAGEKVLARRPRALLLPDAGAGRARGGRRARRGLRPRDPRGGGGRARRAPAGRAPAHGRRGAGHAARPSARRRASSCCPTTSRSRRSCATCSSSSGTPASSCAPTTCSTCCRSWRARCRATADASSRCSTSTWAGRATSRRAFAVGVRLGIFRRLADRDDPGRRRAARRAVRRLSRSRAPTNCCRPPRRSARASSDACRPRAARGRSGRRRSRRCPAPRSPVRYRCTVGPTAATSSSTRRRGERLDAAM